MEVLFHCVFFIVCQGIEHDQQSTTFSQGPSLLVLDSWTTCFVLIDLIIRIFVINFNGYFLSMTQNLSSSMKPSQHIFMVLHVYVFLPLPNLNVIFPQTHTSLTCPSHVHQHQRKSLNAKQKKISSLALFIYSKPYKKTNKNKIRIKLN